MKFFNRFRREKTPDEVLAQNLRDACTEYNVAMNACKKAGLTILIYSKWHKWGTPSYLMADQELSVKMARRTTQVPL